MSVLSDIYWRMLLSRAQNPRLHVVVFDMDNGGGDDDDGEEEEDDDDDVDPLIFDFDAFDSIVGDNDFEEEESSFCTIVGTTGEDDDEEIEVVTEDDGC